MAHTCAFNEGEPGEILWCRIGRKCQEVRVVDHKTKRIRKLTGQEQLSLTAYMMEDIACAQAFQIIHGKEAGMKRYLYLTGRAGGRD